MRVQRMRVGGWVVSRSGNLCCRFDCLIEIGLSAFVLVVVVIKHRILPIVGLYIKCICDSLVYGLLEKLHPTDWVHWIPYVIYVVEVVTNSVFVGKVLSYSFGTCVHSKYTANTQQAVKSVVSDIGWSQTILQLYIFLVSVFLLLFFLLLVLFKKWNFSACAHKTIRRYVSQNREMFLMGYALVFHVGETFKHTRGVRERERDWTN